MRRKPRDPDAPMFGASLVVWSLLQGVVAFLLVAGIYVTALNRAMPATEVRALTFFSLVLNIVGLIFVNRSFSSSLLTALTRPNGALAKVLLAVVLMLATTLLWPWATSLLHFGPLHANDLVVTLGAGFALLMILEAAKPVWRKLYPA